MKGGARAGAGRKKGSGQATHYPLSHLTIGNVGAVSAKTVVE
jgi:hypothetical protein